MRGTMLLFGLLALSLSLASCWNPGQHLESELGYDALYKGLKKESEDFTKARAREEGLEYTKPELEALIEPEVPTFNPLDETTISISVQEETIHNILFIVARNAGLNLVIEPGISLENRVTLSFENAASSLVVEKLLQAYDLAWQVEGNILYVQRWNEKTFDLDFVNVTSEVDTSSGGDIFGSLGGGSGGGDLAGQFTMSSQLGGEFDEDSLYGSVLDSVDSIINEESALGDSSSSGGTEDSEKNGYYALDPIAGLLYVRTTPGKLRAVAKMLNNLKAKLSRQVVIDARILQVRLDDNFHLGVDWNFVANRMARGNPLTVNWLGRTNVPATGRADNVILSLAGGIGDDTINAAIEAMQTFGGVKTLANPHIRAKHGQPALFTSGTSQKYVSELDKDVDDNGNITYTTTTASVFNGVMLGVITFIGDDGKIDMQIYPIKSEVNANSLALVDVTGTGDKITLPIVDVKNVSTTVRVNDGDTIILGGLIDKDTTKTDTGVPGFSRIPLLGWFFKSRAETDAVRELVIIMTIRIVK